MQHNDTSDTQRLTLCTDCRHFGVPCKPGLDLIAALRSAVTRARPALQEDFSLEGTVCVAGCSRPCTVAFQATASSLYLFGDIASDADIGALVGFARDRQDGMSASVSAAIDDTCMPAAIVAMERSAGWLS